MPNQYARSELQWIVDELGAFVRNGFLIKEELSYYEKWLSDDMDTNLFTIHFSLQKIALLPFIEKGLMAYIELAEKSGIHLHLKAPTEDLYCTVDETVVRHIFLRLFTKLLQETPAGTIIEIYVTEGIENCLVEVVSQHKRPTVPQPADYFKKYRITPANELDSSDNTFPVFSKIMEDMNGDLQYRFSRKGPDYFRLKLPL